MKVLLGTALVLPIFVLLGSGFSVIPGVDEQQQLLPDSVVEPLEHSSSPIVKGLAEFVKEASRPAGLVLIVAGLLASIYLLKEAFAMDKVGRERMFVVFVLTFFSLLFWAFFEQSGSSVNNFTDRNVDRVFETKTIEQAQVGTTLTLRIEADPSNEALKENEFLSQEYLGHENAAEGLDTQIERGDSRCRGSQEAREKVVGRRLGENNRRSQGLAQVHDDPPDVPPRIGEVRRRDGSG